MSAFYVTTPIYYVNANPHLGHAYTTIIADALARFHKMLGEKTLFLTGTDEHGDKIVQAAEKNSLSPREFVDEISSRFSSLWSKLDIAHDCFVRTTDERHKKAVQNFLQQVYDSGDIYFGEFGGFYCYGCERFYTEKELQDGLCPQHLTKPQFISEKNYFFRMSKYLPWLKSYLEAHPNFIRPSRYYSESMAMLESGALEDLCISRPKSRLTWGIELPFDRNYVCYVWFDALISYISGIGWPDKKEFENYWPAEHLVAKDILKPHAIFWPCMLKSAGIPLYRHLDVHGYWLSRNTKMSKSLGNVVDPMEAQSRYGLDAFRYFLLREMHFGSDASFSEESLIGRINADLANDLGNLFSRVLSMCAKFLHSVAPKISVLESADQEIRRLCENVLRNYYQFFLDVRFDQALESLWDLVRALNKYVDSQAPWSLHKNGQTERLGTVIAVLLCAMKKIALFLWPVMPKASCAMLVQLGENGQPGEAPCKNLEQEIHTFNPLAYGQKLASSSNLFPRVEQNTQADSFSSMDGQKTEYTQKSSQNDSARKSEITIQDFACLDIQIGTIIFAEAHPNADRILRLEVDFGEAKPRQILSALADYYQPKDLPGKQVCAILNLAPRKIRGLLSYGMILTVKDDEKLCLLTPGQTVSNGSEVS